MSKNKFLIIVDMQNDFVYGPLSNPEIRTIIPAIKNKIKAARKSGTSIIFTRDTHFSNYLKTLEGQYLPIEHCQMGSEGWNIISELPTNSAKIYDKPTFGDRFLAEELAEYYDISTEGYIELCGVCTDICVISNALMLRSFLPNVVIRVDSNCCAGTTPEKHKAALEIMKSCQIEVINE